MLKNMLLILLLCTTAGNCQFRIAGAGAGAGGGSIQSNSPSVFSYAVTLFADIATGTDTPIIWRVNGWFLRDFNSLVPNNSLSTYFSYLYGVSVQGLLTVPAGTQVSLRYGAGPLYLADRTFSKEQHAGAGVVLSAGIWYHAISLATWELGIEGVSALTFTDTQPRFFSAMISCRRAI